MSWSDSGVTVSPSTRTAWLVGAFVEIPIAKNIAFQPELMYTEKGADYSALLAVAGVTGSATMKLSYLDIPLLVRFDIPTTGSVVPYVYAGPNIGFLLRAKVTATGQPHDDVKSDMNTTEFGIAFGGGVRFGRVLAEVWYTQGLTNVLTDAAAGGSKATNRVFSILGGVRF
jgi:hypothetical protein